MTMRIRGKTERKKNNSQDCFIECARVQGGSVKAVGQLLKVRSRAPHITLERLHRRGYESLLSQSLKVHFNYKDSLFPNV